MSARSWTAQQQQAISARGGSVLVSAAAGSGKTAVLVERVIQMVCDSSHPVSLDRLLIVTFTKAAAAEMRERIGSALAKKLAAEPENTALLHQQMLLPSAQICTIDSFCSALVKQNFHALQILPDFRVLDGSEAAALEAECVQAVLADIYADAPPAFADLSALFVRGASDAALQDVILQLYARSRAYPFPTRWLQTIPQAYAPDLPPAETVWGQAVFADLADRLQYASALLRQAQSILLQEPELASSYLPAVSSDLSHCDMLSAALDKKDWDAVQQLCDSYKPAGLKAAPKKYADSPVKEQVRHLREKGKDILKKLSGALPVNTQEHCADMQFLQPVIQLLCDMVTDFSQRLSAAKLAENAFDFSDISHMALQLLVAADEDGNICRTALAETLSDSYDEILLDEYQDTDAAQDMLFSALSKNEENLFTVGDVKQSIYGFRLAMPEIFLNRRARYADFDGKTYPARITLDKNFRSRKTVAQGINYLFSQVMTTQSCGIDYDNGEELVFAAPYAAAKDPCVELHCLDAHSAEQDATGVQAQHIAETVRALLESGMPVTRKNGTQSPVQAGDICILMRSLTDSESYLTALEALGIPAFCQKKGGFFCMTEIRTMVSLLEALNNPLLDVPLCACLLSPIWGFTPDELAEIRLQSDEPVLFRKLCAVQSPKCSAFLRDYACLRRQSTIQTPAALLRTVYAQTDYLSVVGVMPGGETRRLNLLLLLQYAESYGQNGKNSLSGFLRYLSKMQENERNVESAVGVSENADVVRLMTIHKSKGLEFPVVILANCGKQFNTNDRKQRLLLHNQALLGLKVYDRKNARTLMSLPYCGAQKAIARSETAEEMRVLYVALTRAREKLILVGTTGRASLEKQLQNAALRSGCGETMPAAAVAEANSYMDWLLPAFLRHPDARALRDEIALPVPERQADFSLQVITEAKSPMQRQALDSAEVQAAPDDALLSELRARVEYQYPAWALSSCPAKVSASGLNAAETNFQYFAQAVPAFLEKGGLTPAQRGTATHRFAEVCDFQAASADLETEIKRLCAAGILTAETADALDQTALKAFFHSALFQRLLRAERVYREQKFTMFLPASEVAGGEHAALLQEEVLVQGVIDCAFVENEKIVVLDYKTDRVREAQTLAKRYQKQLSVYKRAAESIFGMPVSETLLYSFPLEKTISLEI